jgi:SAM-dependent methyltransferase
MNNEILIEDYYEALARWPRKPSPATHRIIHRKLVDPRAADRPTSTRLHDVLVEAIGGFSSPRILDAGCGFGATALELARRLDAECTGISLSPTQIREANKAARSCGLSARVRFLRASYDDPPPGPFDLVIAIESLAHSTAPPTSLARLARVLAPGGAIVVIDDMPEPGATHGADLERLRADWHYPVLYDRDAYRRCFGELSLAVTREDDLTAAIPQRPWTSWFLRAMTAELAARVGSRTWRTIMRSHRAGFALERLYQAGAMRYIMMIAERR